MVFVAPIQQGGIGLSTVAIRDLLSGEEQNKVANSIADRLSRELVIALIGPIASGVSTAAQYIEDTLTTQFKYKVFPVIRPSDIIKAEAHRVGIASIAINPRDRYVSQMQTAGNLLREKFGGDYLAEKVVEKIFRYRREDGGFTDDGISLPGRRAYIIDSLKHPEELALLRQIYGETLCVFGVFAPDEIRARRLTIDGATTGTVEAIMKRDRGELATFGQKTRKIFTESDFFVCNDTKEESLRTKIERFLDILFNASIHTPTREESAMYKASAAAANSACMSRQVGAAIVAEGGELISVGWNDVPRFRGGLYTEEDQFTIHEGKLVDRDFRCFRWGGCICHNEMRRGTILEKIAKRIDESKLLKRGATLSDVRKLLEGTDVDSLTEYSRAIHAEMEAILSVAREGRHSLANSTLYVTTYPCHNCARHIVASGIRSVVYVEPYDKSLAIELHRDAVTEDPEDRDRVVFRQYDGVAPRNYLRLFKPQSARKRDGKLIPVDRRSAVPIFRVQLDSQALYEQKVIADLTEKEQDVMVGGSSG
jgi:deoxycytidylate deaminase